MNVRKIATISSVGILGVGILAMVGHQVGDLAVADKSAHSYQSMKSEFVGVDIPDDYTLGISNLEDVRLEDILGNYELIYQTEFINKQIDSTENIMKLKQAAQITAINLIIATTPVVADEVEGNASSIVETASGYVEDVMNTVAGKVETKGEEVESVVTEKLESDAAEADEAIAAQVEEDADEASVVIAEKVQEDSAEAKGIAVEKVQSDIAEAQTIVAENFQADADEAKEDIVDSAGNAANQVKSDVEENWGDWESTVSTTVSEALDDVANKLGSASDVVSTNIDESVASIQENGFSDEAAQEAVVDLQDDVANSDFVSDVESLEETVGIQR